MQQNIKSLSLTDLSLRLKELGVEKYRLQQVLQWIYDRDITDFSEMTNLSKSLREELSKKFTIQRLPIELEATSVDTTRKYLIRLEDGETVESVLIPVEGRITLCISSQVGCAMACRYCLTGFLGLKRNLSQFEIIEQVMAVRRSLKEGEKITNIVFMGMGEPMHNLQAVIPAVQILTDLRCLNFAKRKVTVSTSGLVPQMLEFGKQCDAKLAISLCATTNEIRDILVPINRKYPLEVLLEACRQYPLPPRGKITMEYVMLAGVNDTMEDAKRLTKLLASIPCKINLIPFNEFPGAEFKRPSDESIRQFQKYLLDHRFQTNIRTSRGRDILGACGQLKAEMEPKYRAPVKIPLHQHVIVPNQP
jgi:23S rRNA (adenine2503-C2)-methyltransferase